MISGKRSGSSVMFRYRHSKNLVRVLSAALTASLQSGHNVASFVGRPQPRPALLVEVLSSALSASMVGLGGHASSTPEVFSSPAKRLQVPSKASLSVKKKKPLSSSNQPMVLQSHSWLGSRAVSKRGFPFV